MKSCPTSPPTPPTTLPSHLSGAFWTLSRTCSLLSNFPPLPTPQNHVLDLPYMEVGARATFLWRERRGKSNRLDPRRHFSTKSIYPAFNSICICQHFVLQNRSMYLQNLTPCTLFLTQMNSDNKV